MGWFRNTVVALILGATGATGLVWGGPRGGPPQRFGPERGAPGMGLDDAVESVRGKTGGRVLSAETRGPSHRVKMLLPGGRVRVYSIDAGPGAGAPPGRGR